MSSLEPHHLDAYTFFLLPLRIIFPGMLLLLHCLHDQSLPLASSSLRMELDWQASPFRFLDQVVVQ